MKKPSASDTESAKSKKPEKPEKSKPAKSESAEVPAKKKSARKPIKLTEENPLEQKPERGEFLIVGLGASAGGIQALKEFFENVPADSGMAYVVILHLSPDHDSRLASVLQTVSKIPVMQVTERVTVEPNRVYVVPPNEHLEMTGGEITVSENLTIEDRRAPVDIFFRTLAESHRSRAIAVILSGTGANGSMGIKRVKERGGAAFVQNPREAEFSEMPRNSIATDLIDAVLNAREIPERIIAYKESLGKIVIPVEAELRPEDTQQALREIFTQLRLRTGHDFSNYKRPTVLRRIERRINVFNLPDIASYSAFVRENRDEATALLKDLLISVTNFFRDKNAFQYLETEVLPKIFFDKRAEDAVRIWVCGCATGEEAYSVAMLCAERTAGKIDAPDVQIFATDIDGQAIATAREGFYTLNDAADVSPERLRRFFTKDGEGYRVRRELRESVLFANHNVIKDPPFSRLAAITCRNVLIYLNPMAQERVMETFHFALQPGGFLFLGNSESVDGAGDLYAAVSKEHHVFQSRQVSSRLAFPIADSSRKFFGAPFPPERADTPAIVAAPISAAVPLPRISFGDLHRQLLEQYAPPSIVVNEDYDIVHLSERAGRFLHIAGGEPTKNLLKLIRPELRLELRTALYQAVQRQTNVEVRNLKIRVEEREETINLYARPVLVKPDAETPTSESEEQNSALDSQPSALLNNLARGFILVIFETARADASGGGGTAYTAHEPIAGQLEEELTRTKSQLRNTVEQFEVQAEELKASNEELQAMNEELRSAAEELETSKEELQSLNEELVTVNQELKIKVEEVTQTNNDFQNLINSTDIATIFLDRDFRVQTFTPAATRIFNLLPTDAHRPITDITHRLEDARFEDDAQAVLESLQTIERETRSTDGRVYQMRALPYRTKADRIGGIVLTFFDITDRKRAEEMKAFLAAIVESADDAMLTVNFDNVITSWNSAAQKLYGYTARQAVGKSLEMLTLPEDLREVLANAERIKRGETVEAYNTVRVHRGGRHLELELVLSPVKDERGRVIGVSTIARDITDKKQAEERLRESAQFNRIILSSLTAQLAVIDASGTITVVNEAWRRFARENGGEAVLERTGVGVNYLEVCRRVTGGAAADDAAKTLAGIEAVLSGALPAFTLEYDCHSGKEQRWFLLNVTPLSGSGGGAVVSHLDISERRRAEEKMRESEERLRLLIESVSDYAIFTLTLENRITTWNTGAEKIFGWTETEAVGQTGAMIFTPEDRERGEVEKELGTAVGEGRAPDERFHLRKDGTRFYASGVMSLLRDDNGEPRGFVKIARDMTEQLAAERAVRDKEILQRLVGAQEDERRRIARDLHDELGQQLTTLKMKLEQARKMCEEEPVCETIDEIQVIARHIDADLDFLAWELRPASLDDLGLIKTLENFVAEWSKHSGVTAEFQAMRIKNVRFAPAVETNLYRITQEALNNTHKHAAASRVSVMLEKPDGEIVLIVEDDGKGFDLEDNLTRSKGIGLIGMQERAALVKGTVEFESAEGKGTTVFVRVPVGEEQGQGQEQGQERGQEQEQ